MTSLPTQVDAITLFVEELGKTTQFYRDIFDLTPIYEDDVSALFAFGETYINLLAMSEAPDLIAPAKVAMSESGSRVQFSIFVDDVDATCALLRDRNVALINGPIDRSWGKRTAAFSDPAGNIWEIAQDIPTT